MCTLQLLLVRLVCPGCLVHLAHLEYLAVQCSLLRLEALDFPIVIVRSRSTVIVQSYVCYRGANRTLYTLNSLRPSASNWSRRTLTALRIIVRCQSCEFTKTENAAPLLLSSPVYLEHPEGQCFQWAPAALEAL